VLGGVECPIDPSAASGKSPWTQSRRVNLKCGTKIISRATSFVVITSPEWANFWSEIPPETVTLPKLFARREAKPNFIIQEVTADGAQIRRVYRLETEGVECEVVEVFDREMLMLGEDWVAEGLAPRMDPATQAEAMARLHRADVQVSVVLHRHYSCTTVL
jgi:hypothetical protein